MGEKYTRRPRAMSADRELAPEAKARDRGERGIVGHQNGDRLESLGGDPDVAERDRPALLRRL